MDDPALADVRISGAFKAGDIDGFVNAYDDYHVARVETRTEEEIKLAAY